MSEEMAIEKLVENYVNFEGYFTTFRVPYKKSGGGLSDIDIIGYNPRNQETLLVEVKAWGSPESYKNAEKWDDWEEWIGELKDGWKGFTRGGSNHWGFTKLDKVLIVLPAHFKTPNKEAILSEELSKKFGFKVEILPIHSLIERLFFKVNEDMIVRRRRYPDTALELLRWIIRTSKNGDLNLGELEKKLKKTEGS